MTLILERQRFGIIVKDILTRRNIDIENVKYFLVDGEIKVDMFDYVDPQVEIEIVYCDEGEPRTTFVRNYYEFLDYHLLRVLQMREMITAMMFSIGDIGEEFEGGEEIKKCLKPEEFESLKEKMFDDIDKNTDCNICLCEFEEQDKLVELKCGHYFHKECIRKWLLEESLKCPICKVEAGDGVIIFPPEEDEMDPLEN